MNSAQIFQLSGLVRWGPVDLGVPIRRRRIAVTKAIVRRAFNSGEEEWTH